MHVAFSTTLTTFPSTNTWLTETPSILSHVQARNVGETSEMAVPLVASQKTRRRLTNPISRWTLKTIGSSHTRTTTTTTTMLVMNMNTSANTTTTTTTSLHVKLERERGSGFLD